MGAVFKTVVRARERTQVGSTPTRLRQFDFGLVILDEFKQRTKDIALGIIKLVESPS